MGKIIQFQKPFISTYFSPNQMHKMLYCPFEEGCPVQLRRLSDEQIRQIPYMRQVLHLMTLLSSGELKLTAKGYLPPKIVDELYHMGSHSWSSDWFKQKSESKTEEIQVLRMLLRECGLIKTRMGKMSLTAKGQRQLEDWNALLRTTLLFLLRDYNTGWLDAVDDIEVGNVGTLYSLWLLHQYGSVWRYKSFYMEEYAKTFPMMNDYSVYGCRIFDRLFRFIGLCEVNERDEDLGHDWGEKVIKTEALDMTFSFDDL